MGKQWAFIFLGSKITADGDCSHEIKRHLLLGRKAMTNLDSLLKSRDITLPTKVHIVKAIVFLVVMYGCESWTIEKAEGRRIDASWRRLLRVPWTARKPNQSILNIHWKDWCWSSNTLATWCKKPTQKKPWWWERLKAGGEGNNGRDGWMASQTQWTWVWASSRRWWSTGSVACCSPWGHKESDTTEQLNNMTLPPDKYISQRQVFLPVVNIGRLVNLNCVPQWLINPKSCTSVSSAISSICLVMVLAERTCATFWTAAFKLPDKFKTAIIEMLQWTNCERTWKRWKKKIGNLSKERESIKNKMKYFNWKIQ